uniref:hypothetical protein n=1 Tax=uncultured Vibrio sp. TaxID=114054 RepID=UPI00262ED0C1
CLFDVILPRAQVETQTPTETLAGVLSWVMLLRNGLARRTSAIEACNKGAASIQEGEIKRSYPGLFLPKIEQEILGMI